MKSTVILPEEKSTYPPQGGYHDSDTMLERGDVAIRKRFVSIQVV